MKTIKKAIMVLVAVTWSLVSIASVGGESARMQALIDHLATQSMELQSSESQECTNHCDDLACFTSTFGGTVTGSPCDSEPDGDVDGVDLIGLAELFKNTFVFEGGKVQLPNDGNRLLVITMSEEFVGSITYLGYLDPQGEPVVTGFTIDIGEGLCTGSVDQQIRPLELTLPNGAEVTFSYNGDGTFNFILINGETIYSGENLLPIDLNSAAGANSNTIGESTSVSGISEEAHTGPIQTAEVVVYSEGLLNIAANTHCGAQLNGFSECFASSVLTNIMAEVGDFSLLASLAYIKSRQVQFVKNKIDELGHCSEPGHEDYSEKLCNIKNIVTAGWVGYGQRLYAVLYSGLQTLGEALVNDPGKNVSYEDLCACNPVAYTGLGDYSHSIIAYYGEMGQATCESDAVWFLVLNPDGTVEGVYIVTKLAHQTTGGDVYCEDLDTPLIANLAGQYQSGDRTYWVQGGDFYGDNRFEGSYDLMKMTGSGTYLDFHDYWEVYAYHTNVVVHRAECDQDSDCNDLKWCNGIEECYIGACLAGNPPCEENEICNEVTYECESPPPAEN